MADDVKKAWNEVGDRFSAWGRRVGELHKESGQTDAASAEETERELQKVAKEVVDAVSRGVTTVGKTIRDERAGKELVEALNAFGEAITATAHETGASIRRVRGSGGEPPASPPGGDGGA